MMARNGVQFQRGLSMAEFNARYGTEEQCHAALVRMRWPEGFVCPACGGRKHSYARARRIFQCSACRQQTSAKSGTIFHKSKTPLSKWFLAMHLITSAKNDISSLELARQLGVKWDTAWLIKQKLMEAMRQRNSMHKLDGDVQIDDAYLGGEKAGKTGRGASNKIPFLIAVATRKGKRTADEPAICVGEHRARQHQVRDHRHLPQLRYPARRPLPCRLRVALQSAFRTAQECRSSCTRSSHNRPAALSLNCPRQIRCGDVRVIR
jgi:ribosomal protein L37AE/L43A